MIMLKRRVFFISLLFLGFLLCGAVLVFGQYLVNKNITISEETVPNLVIKEGLLSTKDETVNVVRDEKVIATIKLSKPKIIAQAEKKETWGFFQFPLIYRDNTGRLIVEWHMNEDSYTAYGKGESCYLMSNDEGETWEPVKDIPLTRARRRLEYSNGDFFQERTPPSRDINLYSDFPQPINRKPIKGYLFYYEKDLPEELRGAYFTYWNSQSNKQTFIHASLDDPSLLRYSINGNMAVVWWGDIKEMSDGSLIAGVYGGYYKDSCDIVLNSAISFYKSIDGGFHWDALSRILYRDENGNESIPFDGRDGFCEPEIEVLKDGTILCVMRSGNTTPMYKAYSKDGGVHWSIPEPFTSNGVMPQMISLENGVLVLASGRPGIQLRFCLDGDGKKWTKPIEMMPFKDENGVMIVWGTCGYPSLLKIDNNSFYLVYSDFLTKNSKGEYRKSIMFRKIEVTKQ